jgi:nitrite reductase/ring-hydroxylating ferredoxin subunit
MTQSGPRNLERRTFFSKVVTSSFVVGLVASYGTFAGMALQFLFPSRSLKKGWLYVTEVGRLKAGESLSYESPDGSKVAVARQRDSGTVSDFIALSSTCPHLGCQVQWEGHNDHFFCPCHNGIFDPQGKAISGPPADAKQSLSRYPLKIERDLLFIEVPLEKLKIGKDQISASGTSSSLFRKTNVSSSRLFRGH